MTAIIGAMEEEIAILRSELDHTEEILIQGFTYYRGTLHGCDVVLLQCGIGKVNAAVGAALLIERFKPSSVWNTGSAGGLLPTQVFGDIVVSESAIQHDVDVTAFGYERGQVPHLPTAFPADPALIARAETAIEGLRARGELPAGLGHTRGVIGSGDIFVHDPAHIAALRAAFPQLCAVEMEGAAIAQVCHLCATPFIILRSLSDIAGKESPMRFDEFLPLAARHSTALVLEMLKEEN